MAGWIKLHRDLSDHWLWECEVFSKGQAWVDLIMFAHFSEEPKKIMIKGKLYTLNRGQQARSELTLSKKWKWSRNKVRRFLKKLENDSMLEQHSDNKTSIITISNFDKYQRRETPGDTPNDTTVDTPTGHHPDTTRDTIEECKKEENGKLKIKEGGTDDRDRNLGNDGGSDLDLDYNDQNVNDGNQHEHSSSGEVDERATQEGNDNVCSLDGNISDRLAVQSGKRSLPHGGLLNGTDMAIDMAISGPGINADIRNDYGNTGVGSGGTVHGLDGQETVGKKGDQLDREEEVIHDILGTPEKDEAKPKPTKKKPEKPKNGIVLDYSKLDPVIDEGVMRQFVEFRRVDKKKPVKTQRTLEGIATAALTCRDVYGYDPNHCLLYAMQAGANGGWQLPKPEYFKNEGISFKMWEKRLTANLPKNQNKIKCKDCANFGTCQNAEEAPIASCALYTPQREMVVHQYGNGKGQAKARTVAQMMILENDAIAKALLDDRERKEAMANE